METIRTQVLVLGVGGMGSAAGYHLALRGAEAVLVEQFEVGHDLGSSHGASRIARHSYAEPLYARLMQDGFECWRRFEARAGQTVYVRTGGLSYCPPEVDYVERVARNLEAIGCPHRRVSGREIRELFPQFRVPDEYVGVFEPDAGVLAAGRVVELQAKLAVELGGGRVRLRERCAVRRVDLEGTRPTVVTDGGTIECEKLIVTAGPWTGQLMRELSGRLTVTRQQVVYFEPAELGAYEVGRFPVFIFQPAGAGDGAARVGTWEAFYGFPVFGVRGVKVARHLGGEAVTAEVPGARGETARAAWREPDAGYVEVIRGFLRGHLPGLAGARVVRQEICLYTETVDENFIVGPLVRRSDVIVACGFSGHGFKFVNLMGKVLVEYALDGGTGHEVGTLVPRE